MSKFLRTLAKIGLVELDEQGVPELPSEDLQHEARSEDPNARAPTPAATAAQGERAAPSWEAGNPGAAQPLDPANLADVALSFDEMYRVAELPQSPFPAERLLKLLDGLRAMDPATRRTAVMAMDAADDSWTIDDAIVDAERKQRVLHENAEKIAAASLTSEEAARAELTALDDYAQKAADTIRKQIAELEQLLTDELTKTADKKAEVQANIRVLHEQSAQKRARCQQEVLRLGEIASLFGAVSSAQAHGAARNAADAAARPNAVGSGSGSRAVEGETSKS